MNTNNIAAQVIRVQVVYGTSVGVPLAEYRRLRDGAQQAEAFCAGALRGGFRIGRHFFSCKVGSCFRYDIAFVEVKS